MRKTGSSVFVKLIDKTGGTFLSLFLRKTGGGLIAKFNLKIYICMTDVIKFGRWDKTLYAGKN